jgi:hypothetical protein
MLNEKGITATVKDVKSFKKMNRRNSDNMTFKLCIFCNKRIYLHRTQSHICNKGDNDEI